MRKTYMTPACKVYHFQLQGMIAQSYVGVVNRSTDGIKADVRGRRNYAEDDDFYE